VARLQHNAAGTRMTAGALAIRCRGHRSCASGILPSWKTGSTTGLALSRRGMRPAIECQVRQESAAARDGRKPMRTQRSSRALSIEEQRLLDSLTGASTARQADSWPLAN